MKRIFTLLTICLAALSLAGCNSYSHRARIWVCDQVDHFVCPDGKRHALYYFEDYSYYHASRYSFTKVDLDDKSTSVVRNIICSDGSSFSFSGLESIGLPEDKGYKGSDEFIITVRDVNLPADDREAGIIFDTYNKKHKKICQGNYVRAHGYGLVSCAHVSRGISISGVDIYDIEGNKLEPKEYRGSIARQDVVAEIVEKDGAIAGSYYYTKYGPGKHRIWIYGHIDENGRFAIDGYNESSYGTYVFSCESWSGVIKNGVMDAKIHVNHTNRDYDFTLIESN